MAMALNDSFQSFRLRLLEGRLGQFLGWWASELLNAMPARLRERAQHAKRRLLVQVDGGEIRLGIEDAGATQPLDALPAGQDAQILRQRLRESLQRNQLMEVNRYLLLPEAVVLRTRVSMPLAAEANLKKALAYEMDRHTPFQAEDVFYNWRVINRDREAGRLHFDLYVTPRAPVLEQIETVQRLGLAPAGVDAVSAGQPLGINLLPDALRHTIVSPRARFNRVVAAVTLLLVAFVMVQSLWLREHQLKTLGEAIDSVRAEALAVQQIRKQIDDAVEAAGFLQGRRADNGYMVEVLAELTRILPMHTYLDRLTVNASTAQMQGKSDNAPALIEIFNSSPFFENASFRGPTRLDNRSRKVIFDLTVNNTRQDAG